MEQLCINVGETSTENKIKSCIFTGHRELGEDFSVKKLKKEIENVIKRGVDTFYNGMAIGFDMFSAETVLKLKKNIRILQHSQKRDISQICG